MMDQPAREFFDQLMTTPGVSGFEKPVQDVVRRFAAGFSSEIRADLHGNVMVGVNSGAETRVMLAGHADQIGLIVSWIDDNGFLYFQTVGGWDAQQLVGQPVLIHGEQGPVPGVVGRKPIHLQDESERKQVATLKSMWIDAGFESRDEALAVVAIGSSVTLRMGCQELHNALVAGPALDNRCGVWVVMEAARRASRLNPRCAIWAVSTVQEEIGLRGAQTAAYSLDPQIGIAVDVTHATDCPEMDRKQQGHIRLGEGPVIVRGPNVHPQVAARLAEHARTGNIPSQAAALGRAASNDGSVLQISRGGVATGIVAIPNRYMHSGVETVSLRDLDHAASLIAGFCVSIASAGEFALT